MRLTVLTRIVGDNSGEQLLVPQCKGRTDCLGGSQGSTASTLDAQSLFSGPLLAHEEDFSRWGVFLKMLNPEGVL